jgi:hypothetical protein
MLGLAFKTKSHFLVKLKKSREVWHLATIQGHSQVQKFFPFYPADLAALETHGIITVSQIFKTHFSGGIYKTISPAILYNT